MATLFDRLIGLGIEDFPATPSDRKVAIHAFSGCINFYGTGDITGPNIATWFDLVGEQVDDAIYMSQLATDAQDVGKRNGFMRIFKDFLYNGEWGTAADPFQDELTFWKFLRQAVSDGGGTPTPIPQYLLDRFGL